MFSLHPFVLLCSCVSASQAVHLTWLCGFPRLLLLSLLRYSKCVRHVLYQSQTACAICPTGILDAARCLFASRSSICFVVRLATGAAVDDAVADDEAGLAAGFGICFPVLLDFDLLWDGQKRSLGLETLITQAN